MPVHRNVNLCEKVICPVLSGRLLWLQPLSKWRAVFGWTRGPVDVLLSPWLLRCSVWGARGPVLQHSMWDFLHLCWCVHYRPGPVLLQPGLSEWWDTKAVCSHPMVCVSDAAGNLARSCAAATRGFIVLKWQDTKALFSFCDLCVRYCC